MQFGKDLAQLPENLKDMKMSVKKSYLSFTTKTHNLLVELINHVLWLQRLLPGKLLIYTDHNYLESAFFVNS